MPGLKTDAGRDRVEVHIRLNKWCCWSRRMGAPENRTGQMLNAIVTASAVAEQPLIPLELVVQCRGHGQARKNRQRPGHKDDREVESCRSASKR